MLVRAPTTAGWSISAVQTSQVIPGTTPTLIRPTSSGAASATLDSGGGVAGQQIAHADNLFALAHVTLGADDVVALANHKQVRSSFLRLSAARLRRSKHDCYLCLAHGRQHPRRRA